MDIDSVAENPPPWVPACAGMTIMQRSPCAGRTVAQGSPPAGRTVALPCGANRYRYSLRRRATVTVHAGDGRQVFHRGLPNALDGAEPAQQHPAALRPDPLDLVHHGGDALLRPALAMVGDGEPVRLVPRALHQEQRL